jgi:hypothetical protein
VNGQISNMFSSNVLLTPRARTLPRYCWISSSCVPVFHYPLYTGISGIVKSCNFIFDFIFCLEFQRDRRNGIEKIPSLLLSNFLVTWQNYYWIKYEK